MQRFFIEQMAMYSAYHRDGRNKATHFVGVPAIAVSLLIPMAMVRFANLDSYSLTLATLFAVSVMIYWIVLDPPFGVVTAAVSGVTRTGASHLTLRTAILAAERPQQPPSTVFEAPTRATVATAANSRVFFISAQLLSGGANDYATRVYDDGMILENVARRSIGISFDGNGIQAPRLGRKAS